MWVYTQGFKGIKKLLNNITKFIFTAWKNPIILMATYTYTIYSVGIGVNEIFKFKAILRRFIYCLLNYMTEYS